MVLPESRPAYMTSNEELAIALRNVKNPKLLTPLKHRRTLFRARQMYKMCMIRDEQWWAGNSSSALSWKQIYKCFIIRCFLTSAKLRTEIQRRVSARVAGQFLPYCV